MTSWLFSLLLPSTKDNEFQPIRSWLSLCFFPPLSQSSGASNSWWVGHCSYMYFTKFTELKRLSWRLLYCHPWLHWKGKLKRILPIVLCKTAQNPVCHTESWELSWWQHSQLWHQRLSWWQPTLAPVTTKLAFWRNSVFSGDTTVLY